MRRSPLSRFTGLLLATLVGLSAPGLALAHGHAHHETKEHAEHDREHHDGTPDAATPVPAELTLSVEAAGPAGAAGDHDHPQLSLALSARADVPLFIPADSVALTAYVLVESQASSLLTAAVPRAWPPGAPPRQPRAPPRA